MGLDLEARGLVPAPSKLLSRDLDALKKLFLVNELKNTLVDKRNLNSAALMDLMITKTNLVTRIRLCAIKAGS